MGQCCVEQRRHAPSLLPRRADDIFAIPAHFSAMIRLPAFSIGY